MKKLALLLLVCLGAAPPLPGAVSGQVDLVSRYIWRGFDLLPDNHPAIQPSFTLDLGQSGFSLNFWGSFALAQRGLFKSDDEIDVTLSYAFSMAPGWELSVGFNNYGYWFADDFKLKDNTSQEVYVTVARTGLPLAPELSISYDFNQGSGLYIALGCSHEQEISEKVSLELGGLIGFNSKQYIDGTGFSNIDLYIKVPLTLGRVTLVPALNVMVPLMDEVNEGVEVWFGFSAAI